MLSDEAVGQKNNTGKKKEGIDVRHAATINHVVIKIGAKEKWQHGDQRNGLSEIANKKPIDKP